MTQFTNGYNLEDRTLKFSEELIIFLKKIAKNALSLPLLDQCLRSGTSVGANYREANGASSK
jgi:four helix bundle protein